MKNRWSDADSRQYCDRYAPRWGEALALRVYTSRLIGVEADLVMHGGGNTSVKIARENLLGDRVDALCVKGSGWDLDSIEPEGFPALDLAWLRKLRKLESLSDEEMVNQLRTHLFDATAPNPSVETLLHAFLPHVFIDHTHADAILALTNQPDGAELIRQALGASVVIVPYVMPGFRLALLAAPECATRAAGGPLTPGHVNRTRAKPLFIGEPRLDDPEAFRSQVGAAIEAYRKAYDSYFAEQVRAKSTSRKKLDPAPRV